ncbi:hypothetical protein APHNYW_0004 [Anaplasma phagocytophilum str. ApNYW]|nr:hypothetical protein APHNYW_0004 [Anaplasma phagocytophilum str. ApNYW]
MPNDNNSFSAYILMPTVSTHIGQSWCISQRNRHAACFVRGMVLPYLCA